MAIYEFYRSNTRRINHTVTRSGAVENLAGAALLLTAKRKLSDTYAAAIIKKTSAVGGGITITNAAQGLAQTQILPADTAALCANGKREKLFYDLELQTAAGDTETVEVGELLINPDVTDTAQPVGPPAAPPDPIVAGVFLQHNGASQVWSSWATPIAAPVGGDVGKVLAVSAAGAAAFRVLSFPANPGDDGKIARASAGALTYIAGSATNDTWTWNGTTWVPGAPKRRVLLAWGNNAINTGAAQFLQPWMSNGATDGAELRVHVVPFDGVLRLMRLTHWTPTGTEDITYTVRTGSTPGGMADSALALTLNAAAAAGSNLANSVAVLAGEYASLKSSFTGTNRNLRASCTVMLEES